MSEQTQLPKPGWYFNQQGQYQWWDGSTWGPLAPNDSSQPPPYSAPGGGVSSLVCGIVGLVLVSIPLIGLALSILAVTEANKLRKAPVRTAGRGMAVAGTIMGIVGISLAPFFTFFAFFGYGTLI